jgi:hypothetical protein
VRAHSHATLLFNDHDPAAFTRRGDHVEPHNVFSSTSRLRAAFAKLTRHRPAPPPVFTYSTEPPSDGVRSRSVQVPFPSASAQWTWNGRDYVRKQDGRADVLADGSRVTSTNVVVMSVRVVGTGIFEYNGAEDPLPVTVGAGRCWVLRDGLIVAGHWKRRNLGTALELLDSHERRIALHRGRTWVELMPRTGSPRFRG